MSANDRQVAGSHYNGVSLQHWDYVIAALDGRYLEGNITKYVCRHRKKNGVQDLEKALHYMDKLLEVYEAKKIRQLDYRPGSMNFPMDEFIRENGLNATEAYVVKRLAYWYNRSHLLTAKNHILLLLEQATIRQQRIESIKAGGFAPTHDVDEPFDDGVSSIDEEPGASYTNQD